MHPHHPVIIALFSIGFVGASLFTAARLQAATLTAGDLVKTESRPDVYYYGADGKRYVFPNEKTYLSWYSGFDTKTLSDSDLAALSIGGAVTYRPGSRLVKLTTDPKVYAVAKGGTLRWVQSETVAVALYGATWNSQIDDLPDTYFATYKVGAPITSASDFSPSTELTAATTISADKDLAVVPAPAPSPSPTPTPTPTSTAGTLAISVTRSPVSNGETEEIIASATHPSGIVKINLFFDDTLVTTCVSAQCVGDVTAIPKGKTSLIAKAEATAMNGDILTQQIAVPVNGTISGLVNLTVSRPIIRTGQVVDAVVNINSAIGARRTDIFRNDVNIHSCASSIQECRWSNTLSGPIGTVFTFYGKVTDTAGRVYESVRKTITVADNDVPIVSLGSDRSSILKGQSFNLTATAGDDDGVASLQISKDGTILKTCQGTTTCTVASGPWNDAEMLSFSASATDLLGATSTLASTSVTVQ